MVNKKMLWTAYMLVLAVLLYVVLTGVTFLAPNVLLVFAVAWVASPILFFVFAYTYERASKSAGGRGATAKEVFVSVFGPKEQAYSFLYGDTLLLPGALAAAAYYWQNTDNRVDLSLWWWWILSLVIGIAAGFGWHFKMETPGYTEKGFAPSLNSPTKLFHDFVSYPVLFGGLVFVTFPMFFHIRWDLWADWPIVAILALVGAWLFLGAKVDNDRAKKLVPWNHSGYDLENQVCIPYI